MLSLASFVRGKAVGEGNSVKNWQFIFLEVVIERQPTVQSGHEGRPVTTTIDLMRDEEGEDAAENPSAGSFGKEEEEGSERQPASPRNATRCSALELTACGVFGSQPYERVPLGTAMVTVQLEGLPHRHRAARLSLCEDSNGRAIAHSSS